MNKYTDFLNKLNLPTKEEFNDFIDELPPYEELSDDFEYNPYYDSLEVKIFDFGVLKNFHGCRVYNIKIDEKVVYIDGIDSLEQLNELQDILTAARWTLGNYEDELEYWTQTDELISNSEKSLLLNELGKIVTTEQLKQIIENVNKIRLAH